MLDLSKQSPWSFKKKLSNIVRHYFINLWEKEKEGQKHGKLIAYITFKNNFGREHYLFIINIFVQRKNITKFRISAHQVNIERGRYIGLPPELRVCFQCNMQEIEDEHHFFFNLFICSKYNDKRLQLMEVI
jgi:hypothetical protein